MINLQYQSQRALWLEINKWTELGFCWGVSKDHWPVIAVIFTSNLVITPNEGMHRWMDICFGRMTWSNYRCSLRANSNVLPASFISNVAISLADGPQLCHNHHSTLSASKEKKRWIEDEAWQDDTSTPFGVNSMRSQVCHVHHSTLSAWHRKPDVNADLEADLKWYHWHGWILSLTDIAQEQKQRQRQSSKHSQILHMCLLCMPLHTVSFKVCMRCKATGVESGGGPVRQCRSH